jgi:hypothetical protein
MAIIAFNENTSGADISVQDDLLLKAFTSDSVTNIVYLEEEDGYRKTAKVSSTLANVGAQSNNLIAVTDEDSGATVWVNKNRINGMFEDSGAARLRFDSAGAQNETIKVTETATAVRAATYEKDGDFAYAIDSFTASPNKVILDSTVGDVTAKFTAGVVFTVFGEGDSNDGIYSVVSSAYPGGTETEITVTEVPTAGASTGGKVWLKA